ncbi:tetraspanin-19-like [Zingiber officinale]|uniref:tetraspanin-19-like n=1 Tax=Zingiber officinale TaxID=94328 RepID=UPI001C4CAAB5|nr:tetraspanin-19-like [Zingiber officinale]
MAYCKICLLNNAMRVVNLVVNFCGLAIIIYSLCLLKAWKQAVAEFDAAASTLPAPWFIHTLLGVGIVVCFSAIVGHAVSNSLEPIYLSLYIVFIFFILFCEIVVIVAILFEIDWPRVIAEHFEGNIKFVDTFSFHAYICRLLGVIVLLAQVNVLVLAVVLRTMGPRARNHCQRAVMHEFGYSFLVTNGSESPATLSTIV